MYAIYAFPSSLPGEFRDSVSYCFNCWNINLISYLCGLNRCHNGPLLKQITAHFCHKRFAKDV